MGTPDQLFLPFAQVPAFAEASFVWPRRTAADETAQPAFKYRVRENRRAKRIILRVTATHGLEVVVPSAGGPD